MLYVKSPTWRSEFWKQSAL